MGHILHSALTPEQRAEAEAADREQARALEHYTKLARQADAWRADADAAAQLLNSINERNHQRGAVGAWVLIALIAIVVLLAGCGGSMDDDEVQPHFCHTTPRACV
jgi:ferric-dicitrate binding protein FerR (iron transport regulator)